MTQLKRYRNRESGEEVEAKPAGENQFVVVDKNNPIHALLSGSGANFIVDKDNFLKYFEEIDNG